MATGQTRYPTLPSPDVNVAGPLSGFGEMLSVQPTPTSQLSFVYTLNPLLVETLTYGTGASAAAVNGEATLTSGSSPDGYARLVSRKVAKYRAGQATSVRWTARFSAGSTGNRQMAGPYNIEAGYQIGYNGTQFGILYTEGGTVEVQTLTVSAAPAAPGNVTVTLDAGTPVVVAVTASGNTSVTASEIAAASYAATAGGWTAQATANVVYFTRRLPGPAGASTFNAGATGMAATFAILTTGVAPSEQFIPQAAWNGVVPTGFDPTKGNVYAVQFQYLGYGDAFFYIEDGTTGRFNLVHTVRNAGTRTSVVLRNPNLYLTWESRNTGTGTSVTLRGASGGTFIEGPVDFLGAQFAQRAGVSISAGVETPVLSVRASTTYQSRISTAQLQIDRIAAAAEGTKPLTLRLYKNASLTAAQWQQVAANVSTATYDASATGFSGGTLIFAFTLAKTGNSTEALSDLSVYLQAGESLTLTALSANNADVAAALVWVEDV